MRFLTTIEVVNEYTSYSEINADYEFGLRHVSYYLTDMDNDWFFTTTPTLLNGKSKEEIAEMVYNSLLVYLTDSSFGDVLIESYIDVFRVGNKIYIYSQSEQNTYYIYSSPNVPATQDGSDAYSEFLTLFKNDDGVINGIFRGIEVLDLNITEYETIVVPTTIADCNVGVYVEFTEINPRFLNISGGDVIKSFTSEDVTVTSTVIGNDTIIGIVERGLGDYAEFVITDYMDKTYNFKTYIPSKLLEEDFEFELKELCGSYILTVKRNKHDLVLSYSYGDVDNFVLSNNIWSLSLDTDLNSNLTVKIRDKFGCILEFDLLLSDIYIEKEDFYFVSSENSIRYIADKFGSDCCFDREDDVKMNEFYFNKINSKSCQIFTDCDNVTTQVLSNVQPIVKKTNLDGFVSDVDVHTIIENICVNLYATVLKTEEEYLFGINTGVKTLKIFLKDYIDNFGDVINVTNGVPSLFLNKKIIFRIAYYNTNGAPVLGSFPIFLDNVMFDDLNGFYINLSFDFESILSIRSVNVFGDLENYNVYEFTTNMANIRNIDILINENTIKSDDIDIVKKTKDLVKITYWSDEDTTLKNTSISGVINLKAINKTISSDINKDTVFLDESINNSNIKTYHKQTISFEPIKIQLFKNLIDAISNKFLTVNDVPMTYESHTSKVLGDTDLIEFSLTFYIDHKRGVKSKTIEDGGCGIGLKYNSTGFVRTSDNINIKINTND